MNYYNCVLCICGTVFGTGRKERGWIISTMGTHDTHVLQLWSTLMDMTVLSSSLPLVSSPIIQVEAHFDRFSCPSLSMLTCTMPLFVQMMELCEFGRTLLTRGIQRWSQLGRGCPTCCPLHEVCFHTLCANTALLLSSEFLFPRLLSARPVFGKSCRNFQSSCMMRDCRDAHGCSGTKAECWSLH